MNGWAQAGLGVVVLAPLSAALLAFLLPRAARGIGLVTAGLVGAACGVLAIEVWEQGALRHFVGGWGAPLGIDLRVDGLAALLLLVTAGVGVAVTVYAQRYFVSGHGAAEPAARHRERYFWPLYLFLWAALNGLFVSADVFNLYVTLELLGFAAVTLVALAGGRAALTAAMRYLLVSLTGSLFYLLGVALVYGEAATVDLVLLAERLQPGPVAWVALALMTGGLLMKAALFPMHFWLPPAHANAPAPVSALLSALVVKGAFYIVLRLWFEAFQTVAVPAAAQVLGALGAAAILWGSIQALRQPRLKLLIAYSTVAQLGYLFLVFPLALFREAGFTAWTGGLIMLGAHACAKTAMFLIAGNVLHAAGHDRIRDLDGVTGVLPLSAFAFGLAGLSLVGLPPSSGFAGKWLLLNAALAEGQWWWLVVILAGSLLAAGYLARVGTRAFRRPPESVSFRRVPRLMEWTALGLALLAVGLGFAANPAAELLGVDVPPGVSGGWEGGGR